MAFRFRRSVKIVPGVRLNLSKSGASVSLGGRGFRHTIGAKGTRTTAGLPGTGLSWTEYQAHAKRREPDFAGLNEATDAPPLAEPGAEFTPIDSAPAEQVGALSTSELAPILNAVSRRVRITPVFVVGAGTIVFMLGNVGDVASATLFAVGSIVLSLCAIALDRYRRSTAIKYEPTGIAAETAEALSQAFKSLTDCAAAWTVQAEVQTGDRKRHAGATRLNTRKRTYLHHRRPACIRGKASFPCVSFGSQELFFLPDAALFIDRKSVTALHYRDLYVDQHPIEFIEDERPPRDVTIVGQTWRFVNKKGGPDRRFNNNRQLPICRYSELNFMSDGGLNGRIQLSQPHAGETFTRVVQAITDFLSSTDAPRPVTSYRLPKRWPLVVFIAVALVFGATVIVAGPNVRHEMARVGAGIAPDQAPAIDPGVTSRTKDTLPQTLVQSPREQSPNDASVGAPVAAPIVHTPPAVQSTQPIQNVPLPRPRPVGGNTTQQAAVLLDYSIVGKSDISIANVRRMVYRVVIHGDTLPAEPAMRRLAQSIWKDGNQRWDEFTVFLYLDDMDTGWAAYGIAEFRPNGLLSFQTNETALYSTKWRSLEQEEADADASWSAQKQAGDVKEYHMTLDASLSSNRILSVVVNTDFPEGTNLLIDVDRAYHEKGKKDAYSGSIYSQEFAVRNGLIGTSVPVRDKPWHDEYVTKMKQFAGLDVFSGIASISDDVEVRVLFSPRRDQPTHVLDALGRNAEYVRGVGASRVGDFTVYSISQTVHVPFQL